MTGVLERLVTTAGKETLARIGQQIASFSDFDKMQEAVQANHSVLKDAIYIFAAAGEEEFRKREGRGYDESTPEELARYQRLLAGALWSAADEIDPERIRLLAAAVVGVTWGDVDEEWRSAAWRAIKGLGPHGVHVLSQIEDDWGLTVVREFGHRADAPIVVDRLKRERDWLEHLKAHGCISVERKKDGDLPFAVMMAADQTEAVTLLPKVTTLGRTVLEILRSYEKAREGAR